MSVQVSESYLTGASLSPRKILLEMLTCYMKPQLLYVAAKLGIADLLWHTPRTCSEIAEIVQVHPASLQRLLVGLMSIGIITKDAQAKFSLTPLGECLVSDMPGSLREIAILQGEELTRAWSKLLFSIQTGRPAFAETFGVGFFSYFAQYPQAGKRFNRYMTETAKFAAKSLSEAYDFSRYKKVVDLGGGNGVLIATLLKRYPHLQGVVFDITSSFDDTLVYLKLQGVAERCEVIQGNFFESVPEGGEIYLLSQVMHDWDDESVEIILRNCRKMMRNNGKLLLYENVMPEEPLVDQSVIWQDLVMLVLTGGKERSENEFRKLLATTGFALEQIIATKHTRQILEAVPVFY